MVDVPLIDPTRVSQRDADLLQRYLAEFAEMRTTRTNFESHWEEVSELIDPVQRNTFTYGSVTMQGEKKTEKQVDATGMLALERFSAILDSLLTPRNMRWHGLQADLDYLMKDRKTKEWMLNTTNQLFKYRYAPIANFSAQNQAIYSSLGAYGNGMMFIDQFDGPIPTRGMRYKGLALGTTYIRENHQGLVDSFARVLRLTARQAYQKWKTIPATLNAALEKGSEHRFDFVHFVCPRTDDYDPERLDARGKPFHSCYFSTEGKCIMQEGGYQTFPLAATRYKQAAEETYGRGPAMFVLPALKTLNAEKRDFLKAGHRAADPVLLLADDGLMNFNLRPGAMNPGGWSMDGKPLVGTLPTGNIQISEEMMNEEKALINDAFLVTLFQILTETPTMTATEVIERTNEKGILLAPTVGRQSSEYLGPMIDREIDLLAQQGLLLPMPGLLREAMGSYEVVHTSPIAKAARARQSAGFIRTLEITTNVVNITGDPAPLDNFNFDEAIPEIADQQDVPVNWMSTDDQIAAKRENRAKAQQAQQQIQAMPAQAAMMKAQAVAQKASPQGQ